MFNKKEWAKIFKNSYSYESKIAEGIWLFKTHRGYEMNIVGDYLELPKKIPANAVLRFDENPKKSDFMPIFATYRLNCDKSYEKILKENVHQKTRNLIYKAEKNNVKNYVSEDLKTYYKMYARTMLRINAIPQSFVLFKEMKKEFKDKMLLFLSEYNGEIVSGIICLLNGKRLHVWSNAQKNKARKVSANMGTYAEILKFACKNKLEVDFGNTEPETSLAFFKSRFGAEKVPIYTNENLSKNSFANNLVCKLLSVLPINAVSACSRVLFTNFR